MNKISTDLQVRFLILGGGLTGLSTAYHLEKQHQTDYLLVEKNPFFGGLCASQTINGFTFDYSGHLLHLHHPYARRLVHRLLKGNLLRHTRNAFIHIAGRKVPFPFQANLWALPPAMRKECLQGAQQAAAHPGSTPPKNFEQWALRAFGPGIYKHFLKPYNQKLWQTPPQQLTWDWCGDFVPAPDIAHIEAGAKRSLRKHWGYNTTFYYPKSGGSAALIEALVKHIPNTWLHAQVEQVDLKNHRARVNGKWIHYEQLINTLPLPQFVALCQAAPTAIRQAASRLQTTAVHVLHVAIKRRLKPFHWMYFPEPEVPFYRVGMQSAFSPKNAPAGTTSLYIETAQPLSSPSKSKQAFLKALQQKGIIKESDKILFSFWQTLCPAYAIYDAARSRSVQDVQSWLQKKQVHCAGRYGNWEYSFMERNLLQGKELAAQLVGAKK